MPSPGARQAALLVFHGIGEQDPYQPLDAFVRGLRAVLRLPPGSLEHRLSLVDGRAITAVRLKLPPQSTAAWSEIDISEFYWAPMVQGRISVRQVLVWLFQTGVRPLLRWSDQPALLRPKGMTAGKQAWLFLRTLGRSFFLLLLAMGLVLPFVYVGLQQKSILKELGSQVWPLARGVLASWQPLLGLVVALFLAYGLGRSSLELLRGARDAKHALTPAERLGWGLGSAAVALAAAGVAAWLLLGTGLGPELQRLTAGFLGSTLAVPVGILLLSAAMAVPLVRFVGDVPLYVTQNERSPYYKTRQEILEQSTKRLKALLSDPEYDGVYLAGHSLGSVIAYDTINCMNRELRASAGASAGGLRTCEYDKLRGLLTFGSPLDKIYYFFRARVKEDEEIRAQLESSLHGFRRAESGRKYDECRLVYSVPQPTRFQWLNIHAAADPVGAHLDYYRLDRDQPCLPYWNPLTAHTKYWNDFGGFYPMVAQWLGLEVQPAEMPTLIARIRRISPQSLERLGVPS